MFSRSRKQPLQAVTRWKVASGEINCFVAMWWCRQNRDKIWPTDLSSLDLRSYCQVNQMRLNCNPPSKKTSDISCDLVWNKEDIVVQAVVAGDKNYW